MYLDKSAIRTRKMKNKTNRWRILILACLLVSVFSCLQKKNDNVRNEAIADSLLQEGENSLSTNPNVAKSLINKAMSLTGDSLKYYKGYILYSKTFLYNSKFDSSFIILKKTLRYLKKRTNSKNKNDLLCTVYNAHCAIFGRIGQLDSALYYGNMALKYCTDKTKAPDIYINLSDNYNMKGNYPQAALCLRNALTISDKYNLNDLKFPIYFGLGCLYLNLRDFPNSDKFFKKAEKDYKERKDSEKEIYCNNRGNYYYFTNQFKTAELWFKRGVPLALKMKDQLTESLYYSNLADVYLQLGDYRLSKYYADRAEEYFDSINFTRGLYYLNSIRIGLAVAQKKDDEANKLKEKTIDESGVDPNLLAIRYKYLEKLAIQESQYKEAYEYLKKGNELNDSVRNDLTQKKIAELSLRYRQDTTLIKKGMLIQQQKSEMKTLRLGYYVWILLFILLGTATFYFYFDMKRRHKLQREKYINQIIQYRISNIRNRISPHLLFNVLNHEMKGLDEERKKHFYTLANLLRESLVMAEKSYVSLAEEIKFTQTYVDLERFRMDNSFNIRWTIDPNINLNQTNIIPMLLQIPIENSIKHGFVGIDREKWIMIKIAQCPEGITISIQDNGVGYHPNKKKEDSQENTGTGMKIVSQTIRILNYKNSEKIKFDINNIEDATLSGTKTDIFIPWSFKFEVK